VQHSSSGRQVAKTHQQQMPIAARPQFPFIAASETNHFAARPQFPFIFTEKINHFFKRHRAIRKMSDVRG
jgi:hypothetical protein